MRRLALLDVCVLVAVIASGCGYLSASPAAGGGMDDIVAALVVRGAAISDQVAGDPGCSDRSLFSNAVRLDVRMPAEALSSPVYIFGWRRQSDYDAASSAFTNCVSEFGERTGAERIDQIGVSPWRAYGPDWPPALKDAVSAALTEAAGR